MSVMDGIKIPTHSTDAYRTGYDRIFSGKDNDVLSLDEKEHLFAFEAFKKWRNEYKYINETPDHVESELAIILKMQKDAFMAGIEWQKKRK